MGNGLVGWSSRVAVLVACSLLATPAPAGDPGPGCEPLWSEVIAPTVGDLGASALGAMAVVSPSDIWATGNYVQGGGYHSLIEHWDGESWKVVPSVDGGKKFTFLTDIAAAGADDVWAVGYSADAIVGTSLSETVIERWRGESWSRIESPNLVTADVGEEFGGYEVSNELFSVAVVGPDDIWAVGHSYTFSLGQELIVHWTGERWSVVPSPHPGQNAWLRSVVAISATDVWAFGEVYNEIELGGGEGGTGWMQQNLIEHWDGNDWVVVESPNQGPFVNGILRASAVAGDDIWAVGYHLTIFGGVRQIQQPTILHYDGQAWSVVFTPALNEENTYLFSVSARATDDVFFAGFFDTGPPLPRFDTLIYHWDGEELRRQESINPANNNELYAIAAVAPGEAWATGRAYLQELPYGALIEHYATPCSTVSFVRGNANGDGAADIADAITILSFLFLGAGTPPCLDALDADDDGALLITDPIYLLSYLFLGGEGPPPPFPQAGSDPSADGLSCAGAG